MTTADRHALTLLAADALADTMPPEDLLDAVGELDDLADDEFAALFDDRPATFGDLAARPAPVSLPVVFSEAPADKQFSLPGPAGERAYNLMAHLRAEGTRTLYRLAERAVSRLVADPAAAQSAYTLFDDDELAELKQSLAATVAAADMLGRARIAQLAAMKQKAKAFAEYTLTQSRTGGPKAVAPGKPPLYGDDAVAATQGGGEAAAEGGDLPNDSQSFDSEPVSKARWDSLSASTATLDELKAHATEVVGKLTDDQKESTHWYTGGGYLELNQQMRECPPSYSCVGGENAKKLAAIAAAIDASGALPKPVYAERGIRVDAETQAALMLAANKLKRSGGDFQFPSFTSASQGKAEGAYADRNVRVQIVAATGLYAGPVSAFGDLERELIIGPKAKYQVADVAVEKTSYGNKHLIIRIIEKSLTGAKESKSVAAMSERPLDEKRAAADGAKFVGDDGDGRALLAYLSRLNPKTLGSSDTDPKAFSEQHYVAFAEGDEFAAFAEPVPPRPPLEALDYFRKLVPSLDNDPLRYGPLLDRHAFTLAYATDQTMLESVKRALLANLAGQTESANLIAGLEGERNVRGAELVQSILDRAGVSPRDDSYASLVYRTNTLDAYHQGMQRELAKPEVQEMFPAWRYLGIKDGREGDDHRPNFGRVYPVTMPFTEARGPRPYHCRCSAQPMDREELKLFIDAGGVVETTPQYGRG